MTSNKSLNNAHNAMLLMVNGKVLFLMLFHVLESYRFCILNQVFYLNVSNKNTNNKIGRILCYTVMLATIYLCLIV